MSPNSITSVYYNVVISVSKSVIREILWVIDVKACCTADQSNPNGTNDRQYWQLFQYVSAQL